MSTPSIVTAATARSILSCPASVGLVVDGVDDVLADLDHLDLQDQDGVPTFSCPTSAPLARAAERGRRALVSLESGLGAPGTAERSDVLTIGGRLTKRGRDTCTCCSETRDVLVVVVDLVVVTPSTPGSLPVHVAVEDFVAPAHQLNRGFLQRCVEHASHCHQDELCHAVAALLDCPVSDIAGVTLSDLTPAGVGLRWIDASGSQVRRVSFPQPAVTPAELGELLRRELSAGLC
ncbi:hypothetical protein BH09ACT12_BH09ACT12_08500 [soil metagenome]